MRRFFLLFVFCISLVSNAGDDVRKLIFVFRTPDGVIRVQVSENVTFEGPSVILRYPWGDQTHEVEMNRDAYLALVNKIPRIRKGSRHACITRASGGSSQISSFQVLIPVDFQPTANHAVLPPDPKISVLAVYNDLLFDPRTGVPQKNEGNIVVRASYKEATPESLHYEPITRLGNKLAGQKLLLDLGRPISPNGSSVVPIVVVTVRSEPMIRQINGVDYVAVVPRANSLKLVDQPTANINLVLVPLTVIRSAQPDPKDWIQALENEKLLLQTPSSKFPNALDEHLKPFSIQNGPHSQEKDRMYEDARRTLVFTVVDEFNEANKRNLPLQIVTFGILGRGKRCGYGTILKLLEGS